MVSHVGDVILDGLTYDLIRSVVVAIIMTAAAQYILGPVFHLLKEKRDAIGFGIASFFLFLALASLIGSRTSKPDLEGGIAQVLMGPSATDERKTVAMFEINVLNKGHMQTILKQWKVEAISNGSRYTGMFPPMPSKVTFDKIPRHPNGVQPTAISYNNSDNILPKSATPIPVGGQLPGILFVLFDNVDPAVFRTGVLFRISYQDVFSHEYQMEIRTTGRSSLISYNPDLKTETACPIPSAASNELTTSKLPPMRSPPLSTPVPSPTLSGR